jgi:flagellar biogenesis protein FliO
MEKSAYPQFSEEPKSFTASVMLRIRSIFSEVSIHRRPRRLKLCETLSLGEKRLLAVVECENQRFLLAATSQNISLLQTLGASGDGEEKSGR